jgi:ribosomal protein L3
MGGRMGGKRITTLNLKVVSIDTDQNLLLLRGAVPGAPNGVVLVRRAIAKKKDPQPQPEKAKKGKSAAGKKKVKK